MPTRPGVFRPAGVTPAAERVQRYDAARGSAASRGYGRDWRRVREAHLRAEPLCRFCLATGVVRAAEEVDHIVPIERAPGLRLVDANLRSLCKTCHSRRTASEQAAARDGAG